jgi:hypothetical protein
MSTVEVVLEFFESVVHTVLRQRHIYPPALFEKRAKYGVGIWKCIHPDVNAYIARVLANMKHLLDQVRSFTFVSFKAKLSNVEFNRKILHYNIYRRRDSMGPI